MSWGGPEFVLAIIAISTAGWLISSWIRARHGYPVENEFWGSTCKADQKAEQKVAQLTDENDALRTQLERLNERMAVLERIATDKPGRIAREIDALAADDGGKA